MPFLLLYSFLALKSFGNGRGREQRYSPVPYKIPHKTSDYYSLSHPKSVQLPSPDESVFTKADSLKASVWRLKTIQLLVLGCSRASKGCWQKSLHLANGNTLDGLSSSTCGKMAIPLQPLPWGEDLAVQRLEFGSKNRSGRT